MTPGRLLDVRKERRHLAHALTAGLVALGAFLLTDTWLDLSQRPSGKLGDFFASVYQRVTPPPPAARDIVLVGIDSQTAARMKERWPYPRKTFATVLDRLHRAGARAIGLDFSFFGGSADPAEDELLRETLSHGRVVLGAGFGETGGLVWSTLPELRAATRSGIVNKLQDRDGVLRHALTYLVSTNPKLPKTRVFSLELKLLEASREVNLASMEDHGRTLAFKAASGELRIPVDARTKTFAVRFRAHTGDFTRLSFYQVHEGRFDRAVVKDKIVMIGFLSLLFQDLHQTPIGWLPGLTLNANTFLTLHARDFIRPLPFLLELLVLLGGVGLGILLVHSVRPAHALGGLCLAVVAFLALSYALYALGWVWNYARFPMFVLLVPWVLHWSAACRHVALQHLVSAFFRRPC